MRVQYLFFINFLPLYSILYSDTSNFRAASSLAKKNPLLYLTTLKKVPKRGQIQNLKEQSTVLLEYFMQASRVTLAAALIGIIQGRAGTVTPYGSIIGDGFIMGALSSQ